MDFDFHIDGLREQVERLNAAGVSDSNLSSRQFWVKHLDALIALQETDSVSSAEVIQALINSLHWAGVAIEHLEERVAVLEAGQSAHGSAES